ncbi:MAG: pyridoxal 5'-phosphate synthase glutaminase subunit PdxT [Candidatus Eremiobacteraeota bacterium]|nr:pyridoxal 5'-phosphate synthase glutaminase subunit PdxT [Candidatus Eremiobacteraeota bacterium]
MEIGILDLQGSVIEHTTVLTNCGIKPVPVKYPRDLEGLSGLILPGGESTTIAELLLRSGLFKIIKDKAESGMPVYGTCAGLILMAKRIIDGTKNQPSLELMNITARRNAYGRQNESFEEDIEIPVLGKKPFPGIFIRAPLIVDVGKKVEILGKHNGSIIAAREGNFLVSTFHPELTDDIRFHRYFISMCDG